MTFRVARVRASFDDFHTRKTDIAASASSLRIQIVIFGTRAGGKSEPAVGDENERRNEEKRQPDVGPFPNYTKTVGDWSRLSRAF